MNNIFAVAEISKSTNQLINYYYYCFYCYISVIIVFLLQIYYYSLLKEFENLYVEKRRFRLRWDSSPGLSNAGRLPQLINLKLLFRFVVVIINYYVI